MRDTINFLRGVGVLAAQDTPEVQAPASVVLAAPELECPCGNVKRADRAFCVECAHLYGYIPRPHPVTGELQS